MKKYVCDKDFMHEIKHDERNVIDLDNLNPDSSQEDSDKSQPCDQDHDKEENTFTPVRKNLASHKDI